MFSYLLSKKKNIKTPKYFFPDKKFCPAVIEVGTQIPIITSLPRPRWNFKRAKWPHFSSDLVKCLGWIPPTNGNYGRFLGAVISTAKKHIPRRYRKEYVPGWSQNSGALYQNFLVTGERMN